MDVNLSASEVMELANTILGKKTGKGMSANHEGFLPLAEIMYSTPTIQQTSLAGYNEDYSYSYVWDNEGKRVLLRVSEGPEAQAEGDTYKYYMSWNGKPTGLASYDINKKECFFYTTTEKFLTLWHWSPQADNLVPTGSEYQPDEPYNPFGPQESDEEIQPVTPDEPVDPDEYDYASDPEYPEHYGAQGDAEEYYNWPLACFCGSIDTNVSVESSASNIEVYAPGERIYYKYGMTEDYFGKSLSYTTDDVVYSTVHQKFLLKANDKYYGTWANSNVWNDSQTGKARTDTLFSDANPLTHEEKVARGYANPDDHLIAWRITYIFSDGALVDLFNQDTTNGKPILVHDDGPALSAWIEANKGKTARLAPGRVYFVCSRMDGSSRRFLAGWYDKTNKIDYTYAFKVTSGTTIIGNGATLFVRQTTAGWPPKVTGGNGGRQTGVTVFPLNKCSNVTIKGVNFKSLKDRDSSVPNGSNSRFSSSSSSITAMSCGLQGTAYNKSTGEPITKKGTFQTSYVVIEDIECKNISCPLDFAHGTNFTIRNVTATGVVNNGFGLAHSTYENINMTMAPYIGSAMHLFYGGCYVEDVDIYNSTFKTVDPYTEVMITMHGGNKYLGNACSAPNVGEIAEVRFHNCSFEGGGPLVKGDSYSSGRLHMVFNDCSFNRLFDKFITSLVYGEFGETSNGVVVRSGAQYAYIINAQKSSYEFNGCEAYIGEGIFMSGGSYQLTINDFNIYSTRTTTSSRTLFGRKANGGAFSGTVSVKGFYTDFPGPYGFAYVVPTEDESGEIPEYATAPLTPSVGDKYKNTTDNKVYQCTALGKGTQIAIQLNDGMSGAPYTQTHVVTFNEQESITFAFSNISTFDDLKTYVASVLTQAGYVEDSAKNVKNGIGKYCFYPSGATYLDIVSKSQGNFRSSVAVSNMGSTSPFKKINSNWGTAAYQNGEGASPVWEEMISASSEGSGAGTTPLT